MIRDGVARVITSAAHCPQRSCRMKPETTEDILDLLNGYIASAAVGAAMELGIFWLLAEKPLSAPDLAKP